MMADVWKIGQNSKASEVWDNAYKAGGYAV